MCLGSKPATFLSSTFTFDLFHCVEQNRAGRAMLGRPQEATPCYQHAMFSPTYLSTESQLPNIKEMFASCTVLVSDCPQ